MAIFSLLLLLMFTCDVMSLIMSDVKPANKVNGSDHVTLEQTISNLEINQNTTLGMLRSMSNEVVSIKAEMRIREEEFIKVTSDLKQLQSENAHLRAHLNLTVLDSLGADVKSCLSQLHGHENTSSVAFEDFKNELASIKTDVLNVSSEFVSVQDNVSSLYRDVEDIRNSVTETTRNTTEMFESELGSTQLDVNTTAQELHDLRHELMLMKSELAAYSNISSVSTGTSGSSNVYYQVQLQTSRLSLRSDTTLIFDDVLANVGNGYNSTTGVFTAPASGPYLLWVHVLGVVSMTDSVLDIFLHKNDLQIAAGYAKISPILGYNDVSITTITHLKMGDRVWYKGVFPVTVHGNMYSGYGGIMLTAQ